MLHDVGVGALKLLHASNRRTNHWPLPLPAAITFPNFNELPVDIDLDAAASLQPNSFSEMFQRTGPDKGIRIGHQTFSMLRQNAPLDSLSMTARFVSNRAFFPGNIYVFHAVTSPA